MKDDLIKALLNSCSVEVTSDTIEGTWKSTQRTALMNASSTDTRSNTSWKKAEFVVAYIKDGEPSFDLDVALQGWHNITDGFKRQYLIIEEEKDKWCVYDSSQKKIADENMCESFLRQQVLHRLLDTTRQRKAEFKAWLLQQSAKLGSELFSPATVCSYVNAADRIPINWNQMNSLWECSDVQTVDEYIGKALALEGWQAFNTLLDNGAAGHCLEKYKEHLIAKLGSSSPQSFELGLPRQIISYGAPGTGKSFGTDDKLTDEHGNAKAVVFRTTLHPDSDYSTFVGAYKPTMKHPQRVVYVNDGKTAQLVDGPDELKYEEKISYEFRAQAFMKAYVSAWKNPTKPVVLVIEEINRGNCAQIFGDLFQLLDRDDATGYSTYPITADTDLAKWLASEEKDEAGKLLQFGKNGVADPGKPACIKPDDWVKVLRGEMLALPPNLYIWATMNTSDQSLFPMDSAFKRRWDWKYVPIAKPDKSDDPDWKERKIKVGSSLYDWWDFITIINRHIAKATESEDKELGYFFVKAPDDTGYITADQFANKVLFYLYGDVFKSYDLPAAAFKRDGGTAWIFRDFFYSKTVVIQKADGQIVKDAEGNVAKTVTDKTTQMLKKPGDVNEFELAAFLDHLKWKDEVVGKTSVGAGADA